MSAVELLEKVERFLRDQTRIVEGPVNGQMLEITWQSAPANPLIAAVEEIRSALPPPIKLGETSRPDLMALSTAVNAIKAGRAPNAMTKGPRYRAVWKLTNQQLPVVARWLDRTDATLSQYPVAVVANKYIGYQWVPQLRGNHTEFPHPMLFGVFLSRPRHIQVPFQFYDAHHYCQVKNYLEEIGLARLIDKSVLPRGSLSSGTRDGAG